ncbi:hypothetical protein [Trujillonella endophytica]|uniref:Uncharacterized protein n=1 Tax=Trujillonella endophytica TaxID=673521 RepID=A0A1H8UUY1_9ACTN|nr:hypothetical protein [Trujillella endophytica]SEP06777.1 hypothetical protein SAMN05660991_03104 [Trujillella endophytica]
MTRTAFPAHRLAVPGLVLALVVTGTLPVWAAAASARPEPTRVCAVDASAPADHAEPGRC